MQFGVHLNPYWSFPSLEAVFDFVELSEQLGFDRVHLPEHTIIGAEQVQQMGREWWDPIVLAALLAARTERIRLFFSVLVLPHRNPVHLAKAIATLDHASGGRVDVGVGVGWLEEEFRALGVPFKTRGRRVDEYIDLLKALWTLDPVSFDGDLFAFQDMIFDPKPVQDPHPPLWIGGSLQASVARTAARGDGWLPLGNTLDSLQAGMQQLTEALRDNDRTADDFPVAVRLPFWESAPRTSAHSRESGTGTVHHLDGDLGATDEYIERAAAIGVTHLWVELPAEDPGRRIAELERFAAHAIAN